MQRSLEGVILQWLISHPHAPYSNSPSYGNKEFSFKAAQNLALQAIQRQWPMEIEVCFLLVLAALAKRQFFFAILNTKSPRRKIQMVFTWYWWTQLCISMKYKPNSFINLGKKSNSSLGVINLAQKRLCWISQKRSGLSAKARGFTLNHLGFRNRFYEDPVFNTEALRSNITKSGP